MEINDFIIGFKFEKLENGQWNDYVISKELSEEEKQYILSLIKKGDIRKMETKNPVECSKEPKLFHILYSALFSVAFVLLFIICVYWLNYIDLHWGSTAEGQVMPGGIKLLQLILFVAGLHSGAVSITNIVDWTDSNFESYKYRNPMLFKNEFDKYADLNNSNDPQAKFRLQWFGKRFYTLYFVSVGLALIILALKMYLGVN
jgi:hypothetical protein